MSIQKRRHLSAGLKARIARETMENQKTIRKIAIENVIALAQPSGPCMEVSNSMDTGFLPQDSPKSV